MLRLTYTSSWIAYERPVTLTNAWVKEPKRFRIAVPRDTCVFNRLVGMDIMKLDKRLVSHVVGYDIKFGAAIFLEGETSAHIWEAFLTCWIAIYV